MTSTDRFGCYYIDFQLPVERTSVGFDTLDLDLDVVIEPCYTWHWKDETAYRAAIAEGGIKPVWASQIEQARSQVQAEIESQVCPLDGSWNDWCPPADWKPPRLRRPASQPGGVPAAPRQSAPPRHRDSILLR
jgi:hypothetical protein